MQRAVAIRGVALAAISQHHLLSNLAAPHTLDRTWRNLSYSLHLLIGWVDSISLRMNQRRWLAAKS